MGMQRRFQMQQVVMIAKSTGYMQDTLGLVDAFICVKCSILQGSLTQSGIFVGWNSFAVPVVTCSIKFLKCK